MIGIAFTDTGASWRLELANGVLVHRAGPVDGADVVLRMPSAALVGVLAGALDGVSVEGDATALGRLMAVLDEPDPAFEIVRP